MSGMLIAKDLLNSFIFSVLGVVIFWIAFLLIDARTPYQLWKEIVVKQNLPLALIVAAMALGISIIVAAAIHG